MATYSALRQQLAGELARFLPLEEAQAESWLWFEDGLGRDRTWWLAHGEETASPEEAAQVDAWLERRRVGEPWAYILGWALWRGRRFEVTRDTLIPRPETELALEAALEVGRRLKIFHACDVGTGSGILGITLALETDWKVVASDISRKALKVARRNAQNHGARLDFCEGSLLGPIPDPVGLVVSNPPYVDPDDRPGLQRELAWEPESALFAADRGLAVATALLRESRVRSAPGVVLEIGAGQGGELRARAIGIGWRNLLIHKDFSGHDRVLVALA
jgi:release factor glutamine methyltransferase